jgi:cytochrome c-type biogenesis protein CcmH
MTGFALLLIVMTVAALAAIAWPFLSNRRSEPLDSDLEVYRAQLEELQRDREAGLISAEDAEAARIEVSRRLLGVARRGKTASPQPGASGALVARRAALAFAVLLVPLISAAMYLRLGSPDLRSGPEATRTANSSPESQTIEQMIARVEAHLQKNPNDGRGWEVLAPVYAKVGRYDDSVRAWGAAIDRLGETAERLQGLGEAMVAAAGGIVTADAKSVFDRALQLDDGAVAARYYRGLAAKQDGLNDEAARIWRDLIASAPPDAGWVKSVRAALARLESTSPETSSDAAEKSSGAVADLPAGQQSPANPRSKSAADETDAMIRKMVERLSDRLSKQGGDAESWLRLVRSYAVLGERDKALAAAADARRNISSDEAQLRTFDEAFKKLGLN